MQTVTIDRDFKQPPGTHLHYEISFGAALPGVDRVVAAMLRRTVPRGLNNVDGAA